MRQVSRGPTPSPLVDTSEAERRLEETGIISNSICGHPEVVRALRLMYLDKCFLCEETIGQKGEVEHFLPWHKSAAHRAYDWRNLHWACPRCNGRKRKKKYRGESQGGRAVRTELIDPTSPPGGLPIAEILTYGETCDAQAKVNDLPPQDATLVNNTADFLNEADLRGLRAMQMAAMCATAADLGLVPLWRTLRNMPTLSPEDWPKEERQSNLEALDRADALYGQFLAETRPYSQCMRAVVYYSLRITWEDFKRLSDRIREIRCLPKLM